MDALDQLVTQVQALSGSEQDVAHLSTSLKQADELLHTHVLRLSYGMAALHPAKHSLGYLYFLCVSIRPLCLPRLSLDSSSDYAFGRFGCALLGLCWICNVIRDQSARFFTVFFN